MAIKTSASGDESTSKQVLEPRLMTVREAARRLLIDERRLYEMIQEGFFQALNLNEGRKGKSGAPMRPYFRIHPDDLEAFIQSRRTKKSSINGKSQNEGGRS